jgi:hypothetical protein
MSVLASLAGAVVWIGELPVKLNPIIQPLMTAIKREQVLLSIFCHFPTYVFLYFRLQLQVFKILKTFVMRKDHATYWNSLTGTLLCDIFVPCLHFFYVSAGRVATNACSRGIS